MTFGSLFAGIGGLDLGLERAGMECRWQVEIDLFCREVLAKHWPDVPRYEDVRDAGSQNLEPVDLICGGFPCQDISYAGKGAGLDGDRSGLWSEFARIIGEMEPRFALVENVSALLTRGLGDVLGTLASLGYDAEWHCIPAAAVGAPHRRDRVFIVAYTEVVSERAGFRESGPGGLRGRRSRDGGSAVPDAEGYRCGPGRARGPDTSGSRERESIRTLSDAHRRGLEVGPERDREPGSGIETQRGDDPDRLRDDVPDPDRNEHQGPSHEIGRPGGTELRDHWATEPDVGRVADGVPARVDRLRGLGNAVVPQVAEWIGRRIMEEAGQ